MDQDRLRRVSVWLSLVGISVTFSALTISPSISPKVLSFGRTNSTFSNSSKEGSLNWNEWAFYLQLTELISFGFHEQTYCCYNTRTDADRYSQSSYWSSSSDWDLSDCSTSPSTETSSLLWCQASWHQPSHHCLDPQPYPTTRHGHTRLLSTINIPYFLE